MNKRATTLVLLVLGLFLLNSALSYAQDDRIWSRKVSKFQIGKDEQQQKVATPKSVQYSSGIKMRNLPPMDSPDISVTPLTNTTQSENSIAVSPLNPNIVLNSNNSSDFPVSQIFGASGFMSTDGGQTWYGSVQGTGGPNSGDPAAAIALSGRFHNGYIAADGGNGAAWSTNNGVNWNNVQVYPNPGSLADKNHLWVDYSPSSPYVNNVYAAWTDFGGGHDSEIMFARSTNGGVSWLPAIEISGAIAAGSHNQGVNIQTGPNGEVYLCWAVYDSWPSLETAIGFAKSTDGGATFGAATRAITNIQGIRSQAAGGGLLGGKDMRTATFPTMTVNMQNGSVYIAWANIGVPGVNTGTERDVWVSKSVDGGTSWGTAVRINQDPTDNGKDQWFPWIACDPTSGALVCIFYDSRDFSGNDQANAYVAISRDGAATWEDFRVSDASWSADGSGTGFSANYAGDYISIAVRQGKVYPCWTDTRLGSNRLITWVSPFLLSDPTDPNPVTGLTAYSDYYTPTSIHLEWNDPTTLSNGDPLDTFVVDIYRNSSFVTSVPKGVEFYNDGGRTDGELYSYDLYARLIPQDSLSPVSSVSWYAGGSPYPAAPTSMEIDADTSHAYLSWEDPTTQADGTPLDDLSKIFVYRNGTLIDSVGVGVEEYTDMPAPGFTYTYYVKAVDNETPRHLSEASNAVSSYVGNLPDFFIWNPDPTPLSGPAIQTIMNNLGKSSFMSTDLFAFGPPASAHYKAVFVCLGIYSNNYVLSSSDPEVAALVAYLNSGGRVYMEGGDTWAFDEQTPLHAMFNIDGLSDGSGDFGPAEGLDFADGLDFTYSGENNYMDQLGTMNGSFAIVKDADGGYNASIAYDGGIYKTIGASFEFGGLDDNSITGTKQDLMIQILSFLVPDPNQNIATSPATLDFGTVGVGFEDSLNLTITNTGLADLTVSAVTVTGAPFSVTGGTGILEFGESAIAKVKFTPTGDGSFEGWVLVASNDPDRPVDSTYISGEGFLPPDIDVSPGSLSATIAEGDSTERTLTIRNLGTGGLEFTISGSVSGPEETTLSGSELSKLVRITRKAKSSGRSVASTGLSSHRSNNATGHSIGRAPVELFNKSHAKDTKRADLKKLFGTSALQAYSIESVNSFVTDLSLGAPEVLNYVAPYSTLDFPGGGDFDDDLSRFFVVDGTTLLTIDTATGATTTVGTVLPFGGENFSGMDYDASTGTLWAIGTNITSSSLYIIDPNVPSATRVGAITNSPGAIGVATDNTGQMYVYDLVTDMLLAVDKNTGAGTEIGSIGFNANYGQGMDYDPVNDILYMSAFNGDAFQAELRSVDRGTGNTTLLGVLGSTDPGGLTQLSFLCIVAGGGSGFLAFNPDEGSVAPDDSLEVEVTLYAPQDLLPGLYTGNIDISSDDPDEPHYLIPVSITYTNVPDPPSAFNLSSPSDEGEVDQHVDFEWTASEDVDGDDVTYTLTINGPGVNETFAGLTETTFSYDGSDGFENGETYTWNVTASDGYLVTPSSNGPFTFEVEFSLAGAGFLSVADSSSQVTPRLHVAWDNSAIPYDLAYHDGSFEGQIGYNGAEGSFAVRFTPLAYPVTITGCEITTQGDANTTFDVSVYLDEDGAVEGPPGTAGFVYESQGGSTPGTYVVNFPDNIVLTEGDFYLSAQEDGSIGDGFLGIGNDLQLNHLDRNWVSGDNNLTWATINEVVGGDPTLTGNFAITAYVVGPGGVTMALRGTIEKTGRSEVVGKAVPGHHLESIDLVKYRLYRSLNPNVDPEPGNLVATMDTSVTEYMDTNVSFGVPYYYVVTALYVVQGDTLESDPSNEVWESPGLPLASVNPLSFTFSLSPGVQDSSEMTISNDGNDVLHYTITVTMDSNSIALANNRRAAEAGEGPTNKNEVDQRPGVSQMYGAGGPDNFGYKWIDSDEPGGPTFNWVDISSVGTPLFLGDDEYVNVSLPFNFNFYENTYSSLNLSANGYLTFGPSGGVYTNAPIPTAGDPNDFIALFWDDLYPPSGGTIYYHGDASRFVVQYQDIWHINGSGSYTFEVILYPDGRILYQYLTLGGDINSHTIGIENATGTDGLQVVYNGSYVHANLAVLISASPDWLSMSEMEGQVGIGGDNELMVRILTDELEQGTYYGTIHIETDDPNHPTFEIPVTLSVIVGVDENPLTNVPQEFALFQNYPNPFNPTTSIKYNLKEDGKVVLKVFNVLGQEVRTLVNTREKAGFRQVQWDGRSNTGKQVSSGVYVYRLTVGSFVKSKKMMLLK